MTSCTNKNVSVLLIIVYTVVSGTFGAAFAEEGSVDIKSEPEGAAVVIDGDEIGNTPVADLRLKPGAH